MTNTTQLNEVELFTLLNEIKNTIQKMDSEFVKTVLRDLAYTEYTYRLEDINIHQFYNDVDAYLYDFIQDLKGECEIEYDQMYEGSQELIPSEDLETAEKLYSIWQEQL